MIFSRKLKLYHSSSFWWETEAASKKSASEAHFTDALWASKAHFADALWASKAHFTDALWASEAHFADALWASEAHLADALWASEAQKCQPEDATNASVASGQSEDATKKIESVYYEEKINSLCLFRKYMPLASGRRGLS